VDEMHVVDYRFQEGLCLTEAIHAGKVKKYQQTEV
jgi:hypothetical protein